MKVSLHFVNNNAMLEIRDILNDIVNVDNDCVKYATVGERSLQVFGVKLVDYIKENYFGSQALSLTFENTRLHINFDDITDFIIES